MVEKEKIEFSLEERLTTIIATIQKNFGKEAIMKLSNRPDVGVDAIPSGSTTLDMLLGIGGYPKGRVIEIFGPESSGKTTFSLLAISEVQKSGGKAAFIDAEQAIDPVYARKLGVNIDDLILSQPDSGDQALQIVDLLVQSNTLDLIVIDSVAALVPEAELEGTIFEQQMGLQARLMSKALRKITASLARSTTTIIFINQLREKIGGYGATETTTGGRALKFFASIRIDVRKREAIKHGDEIIGNFIELKVVKNKVAPPFKNGLVEMHFGKGIDRVAEIVDLAIKNGFIIRKGSWYDYKEIRIGQGRDSVKKYLIENSKYFEEIKQLLVSNSKVVI